MQYHIILFYVVTTPKDNIDFMTINNKHISIVK